MHGPGTTSMLYVVEERDGTNTGLCLVDDELGTCFCGESDHTDLPLLCALFFFIRGFGQIWPAASVRPES